MEYRGRAHTDPGPTQGHPKGHRLKALPVPHGVAGPRRCGTVPLPTYLSRRGTCRGEKQGGTGRVGRRDPQGETVPNTEGGSRDLRPGPSEVHGQGEGSTTCLLPRSQPRNPQSGETGTKADHPQNDLCSGGSCGPTTATKVRPERGSGSKGRGPGGLSQHRVRSGRPSQGVKGAGVGGVSRNGD